MMTTLLVAWLVGWLLPVLVFRALEPALPRRGAGVVCTLAAIPLLLVGAVVLEVVLGYW
jgi:hypothetical protein